MTRTTKTTTTTPAHFTLPAILPAMITGLFILTACGGSALTNDAPIATNTQNDRCADNPLANGCQAGAGFLSVNFDEDIGNQEAESSVAPPAPPPPAPITSVDTHDFTPKTSPSTQSAPAEQRSSSSASGDSGASGQQSATVTAAAAFAGLDETRVLPTSQYGLVTNLANLSNKFLKAGWTHTQVASDVILFDQLDSKGNVLVAAGTPIPLANRPTYAPIVRKNLNRAGLVLGDPLYMNLSQATYDGVAIGGDAVDGIDFYTVSTLSRTGSRKHLGQGRGIENTIIRTVSRFHYAGILAGTDLGAPVSSEVGTAIWNGSFKTDDARYPVDFQLAVGFGGAGARTISAFVKDTATRAGVNDYYLLAGTYDENGLITGTVNYGEFTGGERTTPANVGGTEVARTPNGTIQGLIGVEGAVGVFMSDVAESTATVDLTGATTFTNGYVGGFVASSSLLSAERVLYNDWFESFDEASTGGVHETPSLRANLYEDNIDGDYELRNEFLGIREGATALDETGAGTVTQRGGLTLADDMDSGVSFFSNGITRSRLTVGSQSYAGLLAGTDLGAPINDVAQVGVWKGQFKSVGGYYYGDASIEQQRIETEVDTDFTLTVTFGAVVGVDGSAGSIEAFVATSGINRRFLLAGTYDANGLITGTVLAGLFNNDDKSNPSATINGTLTGLIGQAGAVGAFISNADAANYNYAGGFVASLPEDTANLADWTASFAAGGFNAAQDDLFPAGADVETTLASGTGRFIQWSDTRDFTPGGSLSKFSADTDILLLNDEPNNGIGFIYNVTTTAGRGFAGLLSATDMGAPLDDTSKNAIWTGKIVGVVSAVALAETELRLKVTYDAPFANGVGTIQSIANQTDNTYAASADTVGAVNVRSNFPNTFNFDGGFDANGVITGTIAHTLTANGSTLNRTGVFSGLIGVRGAVGVFKNDDTNTDLPFVGGFVVKPPTE